MKTLTQKALDNGNGIIEVKAGDPGAVYGNNWKCQNDNTDGTRDPHGIVPHLADFNDDNLSLEFFPPDSYRATDAVKYFVKMFCPGKHETHY
jgi:hypothetical protein